MTAGALAGLRVLELNHFAAAPYCTKLLAGSGAQVIKIEPPTGDPLRAVAPFKNGVTHPETGATHLFLNAGKQSVTLDAVTGEGRSLLLRLIEQADVLVTDWEPALLDSRALDYAALERVNPRLVMTAISFFGRTGPYRDYVANELIGFAMGGYQFITGQPCRPPVKVGGNVGQYQGGLHAVTGTMAAVLHQQFTGQGQLVDVSISEALAFAAGAMTRWMNTGALSRRTGNRADRDKPQALYPSTTLPCKDGWVHVHAAPSGFELLPVLMEEPRLADPAIAAAPFGHADLIDELCAPWLSRHTRAEAVALAQELRHPFAEVLDIPEVLADPQHAARGYLVDVEHPVAGTVRQPGAPYVSTETPWETRRAPLLGEHTNTVLSELLGCTPDDLRALRERRVI